MSPTETNIIANNGDNNSMTNVSTMGTKEDPPIGNAVLEHDKECANIELLAECDVNDRLKSTDLCDDGTSNLPIDRGWAWVILAASIVQNFVIVGQLKCYGIFFVQLQKRFHTSSSLTSLVFTIQNATFSVGALLVMNIGQSISTRVMVVLGSVLSVVFLLITAFTENIVILNLVLGVGTGASYAMIQTTVAAVLCSYFVKYRGLANSLYCGGVSLGGLSLAPFFTKLLDVYGYTGTFIISAGLHAQLAIVGVLLRPLKASNVTTNEKVIGDSPELLDIDGVERMDKPANGLRKRTALLSESESVTSTGSKMSSHIAGSFLNSKVSRYASNSMLSLSLVDLSISKRTQTHNRRIDIEGGNKQRKSLRQYVVGILLRVFDLELIKMPLFQYYFLCNVFCCSGGVMIAANIPPHAFDVGIDADKVALLVSMNSVMDVLSKFVFGYIADRDCIERSKLVAICTCVLGVVCQFVYFMNTFATLMTFSVFIGFLQGVYFNLFTVIVLDILREEKFKSAFGVVCLGQGMSVAAGFPIVGALRDYTGHWHAAYTFIGVLLLVGGVMMWFLPVVVKISKRKQDSGTRDDKDVV